MNRIIAALSACLAVLASLLPAAPAMAGNLTIGLAAEPSADPHFLFLDTNVAFSRHVYGALTAVDATSRPHPDLAQSWRLLDDQTWEFTLRPGVLFSDGTPFSAEDVVFSVARVRALPSPGPYTPNLATITAVEAAAPDRVIIRTDRPNPLIPQQLANVMVVSRTAAAGASSGDFVPGRAALGTGPYRLTTLNRGDRLVLDRSDTYWGPRPEWDRVTMRVLTNDASRVAALLSGEVDFIEFVPPADVPRIRADPRMALHTGPSARIIYFLLDTWRDESPGITDAAGAKMRTNPLRDARVRHALSLAVNREALVARVMDGLATADNQLAPAGVLGRDPAVPMDPYDPEAARQLLAEAGYPNGFGLTIACPNNRFVNDERVCQAVGQMFTRIGVRTSVETQPMAVYFGRISRPAGSEFSAGMMGLGLGGFGEAVSLNLSLHTPDPSTARGGFNFGRYSDPALDREIEAAMATMDTPAREARMQAAMRHAMAAWPVIPLHTQMVVSASRRGLAYETSLNEHTLASRIRTTP